jgi:hypothetical protein
LQNKALRAVTHSKYRDHSHPLYIKQKKLKLKEIYKLQIILYMYKCQTGQIRNGEFNSDQFTQGEKKHDYNMRNEAGIPTPFYKTNIRRACIKFTGPTIWNNANQVVDLNNNISINSIKNMMTDYWLQNYSIQT